MLIPFGERLSSRLTRKLQMLKSSTEDWNKQLGNNHGYTSSKLLKEKAIQVQLVIYPINDALWMQEQVFQGKL